MKFYSTGPGVVRDFALLPRTTARLQVNIFRQLEISGGRIFY